MHPTGWYLTGVRGVRACSQVPVDEAKLQRMLEDVLTPAELAALRGAEQEASYNAARAAMRLEKLLEKGVPLSDELVIGCQRGEMWAVDELDRLVQQNLTPNEIRELLAMEESVLVSTHTCTQMRPTRSSAPHTRVCAQRATPTPLSSLLAPPMACGALNCRGGALARAVDDLPGGRRRGLRRRRRRWRRGERPRRVEQAGLVNLEGPRRRRFHHQGAVGDAAAVAAARSAEPHGVGLPLAPLGVVGGAARDAAVRPRQGAAGSS
jgi:hypothetical protein